MSPDENDQPPVDGDRQQDEQATDASTRQLLSQAMPTTGGSGGDPSPRVGAAPLAVVAALAFLVGGVIGGLVASQFAGGASGSSAGDLRERLADVREERDELREEVDELREEQATEPVDDAPEEDDASDDEVVAEEEQGDVTEVALGRPGADRQVRFRLLEVRQVGSFRDYFDTYRPAAGAKFVQARIEVKNLGKVPVDPFCGTNGAVLVDEEDRNFPWQSDSLGIDGNLTCNDGVKPGFTNVETLVFEIPADAEPRAIALWDGSDPQDTSGDRSWVRALVE